MSKAASFQKQFIFNNLSLKGFWLTRWVSENSVEKRLEMLNYLSNLVEQKKLVLFFEVVGLSNFEEALELACSEKRSRKVILDNTKFHFVLSALTQHYSYC